MAASSMYPGAGDSTALQPVNATQQKKILQDVLDTIVNMKTDFFEGHQPITDDSIVLQRFCAKFEHLIQIGLRGKTSLLGRKKDYWDYFCDCLGSSKGSNEGIKYVKSLGENKTSLGRGRAFIRFCLVHQRLADAIQQCLVHDKTGVWFLPGSIFLNGNDSSPLINALYDLNSLHFDLAPRGYDLDSSWPSFSNRKTAGSGGWTVPISRRSSITSMDTLSQISVSMVDNSEVDRLTKDLEDVQSVKNNLIGQIDALQEEKKQASQSAWTSQGEVQAIQEQLTQLQSKHSELQEKYHNMDLNYVHLKMERDHIEKLRLDEMKNLKEEESKRVMQLKQEETIWKTEMREESERRNKEMDKLKRELEKKTSQEEARSGEVVDHWSSLQSLMGKLNIDPIPGDFSASIFSVETHLAALTQSLTSSKEKNNQMKEYEDQIESLRIQLKDQYQQLMDAKKAEEDLTLKVASLEQESTSDKETHQQLQSQISGLSESVKKKEEEHGRLTEKLEEGRTGKEKLEKEIEEVKSQCKDLSDQLKEKEKDLKELNQTMKENLPVFAQNIEESKTELAKSNQQLQEKDKEITDFNEKINSMQTEINDHVKNIAEKDSEIAKLSKDLENVKNESVRLLEEKTEEMTKVKELLAETESKMSILTQLSDDAEKEKIAFTERLSSTEESLESMKQQFEVVMAKLTQTEGEALRAKGSLEEEERLKEDLISEKAELEEKSRSMLDEMGGLMQSIEKLEADAKSKEMDGESLRSDLLSSKAELESLKRELNVEKKQKMLLLQDSDGVKKSEGEKSQQLASLFKQVEELQEEKAHLENKVTEVQKDVTTKEKENLSLSSEIDTLKGQLHKERDDKSLSDAEHKSQFDSLVSKQQRIIQQLQEGALKALQSCTDISDKIELSGTNNKQSDSKDGGDVNGEKEMLSQVEEVFDKLNNLCAIHEEDGAHHEETVISLSNQIEALTSKRDLLLTQTDAALEDTQQIKSQLTQTSEQLALAYSNIEMITKENSSLHSKTSLLTDELSRLEKGKGDLLAEITSLKDACRLAEDEAQEKLSEKRDMEVELEDVRTRLESVLSEKSELDSVVGNLQSQSDFSTKVLEESLTDSKNALEASTVEKLELEGKIMNLVSKLEKANATINEVREENKKHKEEIDSMSSMLHSDDDRSSEMESLNKVLKKEREDHSSEVEVLNQQISALEFELSAEQMANENKTRSESGSEEMEAQINVLESLVENLKEEKSHLEKRLHEHDGTQMSKVSELRRQVQSQEAEIFQLSQELAEVEDKLRSVTEVKDKVSLDLVQLKFSFNTKTEAKERELQTLQSDNVQLKKKLVQLVRDKDELWQRTDQLVDERKRKASEKWQENSEVTKCSQCNSEFSLFLRKHHCRKCGKIFCYSCSDHWVDTPHSSKKSRVCGTCFNLENNDADAANASTASLCSRDSDDEDEGVDQVDRGAVVKPSDTKSVGSQSNVSRNSSKKDEDPESPNNGEANIGESSLQSSGEAMSTQPVSANADQGVSEPGASATTEGDEQDPSLNSSPDNESLYQMITQEEIQTSMTEYESPSSQLANIPDNMSSSMVLLAEDLESGRVNRQNEVWIKPGKMFAVPVKICEEGTTLCWEFSSQPKDVVFSIYFRVDLDASSGEEIVAPCKCNAHKQVFKGELTAKHSGVYTLIFDNTYSRLTSKKVHYLLEYQKNIPG